MRRSVDARDCCKSGELDQLMKCSGCAVEMEIRNVPPLDTMSKCQDNKVVV